MGVFSNCAMMFFIAAFSSGEGKGKPDPSLAASKLDPKNAPKIIKQHRIQLDRMVIANSKEPLELWSQEFTSAHIPHTRHYLLYPDLEIKLPVVSPEGTLFAGAWLKGDELVPGYLKIVEQADSKFLFFFPMQGAFTFLPGVQKEGRMELVAEFQKNFPEVEFNDSGYAVSFQYDDYDLGELLITELRKKTVVRRVELAIEQFPMALVFKPRVQLGGLPGN